MENPIKVFIDANLLIQAGKPPWDPTFSRVIDLVKGDFIAVLTTDLTRTEVTKRHVENDYSTIKEVCRPHFRAVLRNALGVDLPQLDKSEVRKVLFQKHEADTDTLLSALEATVLSIDTVPPSSVFAAYAEERGFFSEAAKKSQFPDAFVFECVRAEASATSPVIVVSADKDFVEPIKAQQHVTLLESVPDLFRHLGLEVKAPSVEAYLDAHHAELREHVEQELNNWQLEAVDIEGAYIEYTSVNEIEIGALTSFGRSAGGRDVLVVGTLRIETTAFYTAPDWSTAMYDSEEKIVVPMDQASGESTVELEADFSMTLLIDPDGDPQGIDDFRFRNDEFIWVHLDPYEY